MDKKELCYAQRRKRNEVEICNRPSLGLWPTIHYVSQATPDSASSGIPLVLRNQPNPSTCGPPHAIIRHLKSYHSDCGV